MALTRLLVVACFSGAILAAFGLQRLLDATPAIRRRMLVVMCVCALVPLGLLLAHLGHPVGLARGDPPAADDP